MKMIVVLASFLASSAFAAEKVVTTLPTATTTPVVSNTKLASNTLAFNFVSMAQGKTNIYFDVGGMSERVSPSLSFRSYSNKEKRPALEQREFTVDRSLVTLGASIAVFKEDKRSILLSPYLYFGTEKDPLNSENRNGVGARLLGQLAVNNTMTLQGGVDANNMEETFKSDIYVGVGFTL